MSTKYKPTNLSEALGWVNEECGEVIAAIGKTIRHGLTSINPDLLPGHPHYRETNAMMIERELIDLGDAVAVLHDYLPQKRITIKV